MIASHGPGAIPGPWEATKGVNNMYNIDNQDDAMAHIRNLIYAYRDAQMQARGTWGAIWQAHAKRVARCREQLRMAIFCHRENVFEGLY